MEGPIGIGTKSPQEALTLASTNNLSLGLYCSITNGAVSLGANAGQISMGIFNSTTATEVLGAQIAAVATQNWTPGSAQGTAIVFRTTANSTKHHFRAHAY